MADEKRKFEFIFRNTNCENKLSKLVKLIGWWVINALKREKSDMVFVCNVIAQKIIETCGISKWKIFITKEVCFNSKSRNKIHLPWKL